jgi:hypothetical protein
LGQVEKNWQKLQASELNRGMGNDGVTYRYWWTAPLRRLNSRRRVGSIASRLAVSPSNH